MCGLTGFYEIGTKRTRAEMHVIGKSMRDALVHRGPDSADLWQDQDLPLLLAHQRLSILDLSAEGAQPMHSASGRYVIVYNGEIYNHLALRKELGDAATFRGRSDTETLLAAIEHWGLNQTLQKIAGMFAFVLWDRKTRDLHCVRDRMGKKPLYLGWAGKALIFGSELKALRAHPDFEAKIHPRSLSLYLNYLCVPAPCSIYRNVWQLPPGHRIVLNLDSLTTGVDLEAEMHPYWSAEETAKMAHGADRNFDEQTIIQDFEALLTTCVDERMISDVPLGAFLSGGIDSSLVTAIMQKISSAPINTYTIGFEEAGFNEADHAKEIAALLGTQHHAHICSPQDARDVIPKLPDIYDEPFADQSAIPTFLVSYFTRQDVTVALSGDGGDEMVGGYNRHFQGPKIWRFIRSAPRPLRVMLGKFLCSISEEKWQSLKPGAPLFGKHMHKSAALLSLSTQEDIYERMIRYWDEPPVLQNRDARLDGFSKIEGFGFAEHMMLWDTEHYLPHDILTKVDRASMAVGLEARAPLLDHRLFEYVWQLPLSLKLRNGQGKWLLREALKRHVPEALFERPKQGFNMPIGSWLRGDLRDWAEDLLDAKTLEEQGALDAQSVRSLWSQHLDGRGNHDSALWSVLMFQAWHERWIKV